MMTSTLIILDVMHQNRRHTYTVFSEDRMEMNVIQISMFLWFGCYDSIISTDVRQSLRFGDFP